MREQGEGPCLKMRKTDEQEDEEGEVDEGNHEGIPWGTALQGFRE